MNSTPEKSGTGLNENQKTRLRVTCEHIDKLLSDAEAILNQSSSKSAFPKFKPEIASVQRMTIEGYISRIRAELLRILEGQAIAKNPPSISPIHAVHVALTFIEIAAEELYPWNMHGYGAVPQPAEAELNGIAGEILGLVTRLDQYVLGGPGEDLKARLRMLEKTNEEFALLARIEEIVTRRGLVEYRAAIANILDRAEDTSFEVAVFGRVSSGKSSLLNGVLGDAVLPVGVTPVTAVPVHIRHRAEPSMTVWFADRPRQTMQPARLQEFAAEQINPGNAKRVSRIIVELPAGRLRNGVTFVDTPGLGSLATTGAAETLAYLPKCDLGVVLIDAGSSLAPEDLQTLMALHEAAVPATVVLSKSDLLGDSDRARLVSYIKRHISSECRLDLPVHIVSSLASHRQMLDEWFEKEILPLYDRAQELRAASVQRKIQTLRSSLAATLGFSLRGGRSLPISRELRREIEAQLRLSAGAIEAGMAAIERETEKLPSEVRPFLEDVSAELAEMWAGGMVVSSVSEISRKAVVKAVQSRVEGWRMHIMALAAQLHESLWQSAKVLDIQDKPAEGEFSALVRDMPVFDLPAWNVNIGRPSLVMFLGKAAAKRRLASQMEDAAGIPLFTALQIYAHLVQNWAESVLRELKARFDSYADAFRAHAGRASLEQETGTEDNEQVLRDLQLLGAAEHAISSLRQDGSEGRLESEFANSNSPGALGKSTV